MTERPPGGDEPPPEQGSAAEPVPGPSVMGGLPRSRPSIRSPRRDAEQRRRAAASTAADPEGAAAAGPGPAPDPSREPEAGGAPGLEDVARAGVSVAAGAAGLGLRIAGRAASAVREALERR